MSIRVVKIGGALLTDRRVPFRVADTRMARLAREIAEADTEGLVLVHGLGSFGRAVMPLYDGDQIAASRFALGRRVQGLLADLHLRFVDCLDAAGVPVSPLDAGTVFAVQDGEVLEVSAQTLRRHSQAGRVPVLSGGTVLAVNGAFVIVSSDRMTVELARALEASQVLWATDVDGVLDHGRLLLPHLDETSLDQMWHPADVASDPSGAMHGKVAEALRLASCGVESLIFSGAAPGRLRQALSGESVTGTIVSSQVGARAIARWSAQGRAPTASHYGKENQVAMPASASSGSSRGRPYKEACMPLPELFDGPRIDTLRYRVHDNIHAAVQALEHDEVDLVDFPVPGDATEFSDKVAVDKCRDFGYYYIAFNTRRAPLDSKLVRKGLAFLIDDVKRTVAASMGSDRVELMNSIMVQYYGRLVNRYLPGYGTDGPDDAVAKAITQFNGTALSEIGDGAIRVLITTDDPIANRIMVEFRSRVESSPELARIFAFEERSRNEVAELAYSGDEGDWHVFCGWQYVQDNLSRWNPGMSKLRLSLDWTADFQSDNSRTRNYVGFASAEYDRVARQFLTTLHPRDLRGAVITEEHLEPWWNNADFWEKGGDVPENADALLLLWKLQWMIADECPIVPIFARTVRFVRAADVLGVWNGDPEETFTYPGGSQPIESTYPGGTLSHWTFQRVRKADPSVKEIRLGLSNPLRHINPLGVGNYWDAMIWSRIYESMLGLNPFLLMKGVAEDAVNLADSFTSEYFSQGSIRYGLHFAVKPGVVWHDGVDFTAQDVGFTYLSMLGARGREMAKLHPSTAELGSALTNEEPIPAWIDMARWLDHIEIADDKSLSLYFTQSSRYIHEWFGDMPIIPMHVWRHLGSDFTRPVYRGTEGLYAISDEAQGWYGLVGTGPFVWNHSEDPLHGGGTLTRFAKYHNRRELER